MRNSSKRALTVAGLILGALIAYRLLFPPPVSDQAAISGAIQSAVRAAASKNTGGVMAVISEHYRDDNGMTEPSLQVFLARAMRDTQAVSVNASPSDIAINGDTATSTTYITIVANTANGLWNRPRQQIRLTWRKERVHRFLVIPATGWRVTGASYGGFGFEP